jgi:hypothetical protein
MDSQKMDGAPQRIAINHDDYRAQHIGRFPDGRQFFLTTPFDPERGFWPGLEFVALYIFSADGALLEAKIENCGPRPLVANDKRDAVYDRFLAELGDVTFDRIEVAPFAIERFGLTFGLIASPPEDEEGSMWSVEVQPGNYMAFFEPWDSGEYDT